MVKKIIKAIFTVFFCNSFLLHGQTNAAALPPPSDKTNTNKITQLLKQGYDLTVNGYPDKGLSMALAAQTLSKKNNNIIGICKGMNLQSYALIRQGNYDSSLVILKSAMAIGETLKDSSLLSTTILYMANAFSSKGDHPKALEYYFRGLKMEEKSHSQPNLHFYFNGIGVLFTTQKDFSKGLEYLLKAENVAERTSNQKYFSTVYNNLGWRCMLMGKNDSAYYFLDLAVKASEESGNLYALTFPLHNIGELFLKLKQYDKAYQYTIRSYEISKAQGFKDRMVANLITLGDIDLSQNKFASTENYLMQGLFLSQQIRAKIHIKDVSLLLSNLYAKQGQYNNAFEYFKLFSKTKDTILNQENSKIIAEMNIKYSTEKKEKEIELLKKTEEIQKLELAKKRNELTTQRTLSISISIGLLLLIAVALLLFSQYQLKKRANTDLQKAFNLIEEKNSVIERSNNLITDSITYAKRIQDAVLPSHEDLMQLFSDNFFIVYKPSQIVSGDFYWCSIQQGKIIFVVADCTGHGVPGAFMSMIGNTLLNEIVNEGKIVDTQKIAEKLDEKIIYSLRQQEGSQKYDGMDISICCIDKQKKEISYTGANHSMYVLHGNMDKIKGSNFSIGGSHHLHSKLFGKQTVSYREGTTIYFLTDGYCDQSGGAENKRFSSRRLEPLLMEIQNLSMQEQKKKMERVFADWKSNSKQRDDVLVVGIKL